MPAQKDINAPASGAKRLGIIAGGGQLPAALAKACEADGIEVFIVALKGRTDPAIVRGRAHIWTRLGALGCILRALHGHNVRDVVPIGSVRRPSLAELRPDMKAAAFFAAGIRGLGDNAVLSRLRRLFESEGFKIRGIQDFMPGLLAPEGPIGKYEPAQEHRADIRRGLEAARILGATDIGQAVIVQEGIVLGVEAAEGTDELIRRCAPLRRRGSKGVLVKICKPGQDRDLDLPTIGAATIENAAQSGLAGIAVAAGASLLADPQEIATLADKHKLFVIGIDTEGE